VLTNQDLEAMVGTSAEWIVVRTGIHERYVGGTTTELSVASGRNALAKAGVDPASIDAVVLATSTSDRQVPATSPGVAHQLGLRCGAFDVNAACSGFVYGLTVACGLIAIGMNKVLLIGTDTLSRITDWTDRNTAVLFADGSGAVVLEACEGPGQLLGWHLDADGSAEQFVYAEIGGTIQMKGQDVFRRGVRLMVNSAQTTLAHAGVTADQIALVVPNQANLRLIDAACDRLNIAPRKRAVVLQSTGNTSAASIPLALCDAADTGRLRDGDLVLLVGFGAGMTAASALLRWGTTGRE
jgi:3-oxoacyl-[acyl-carrier-protein] synthase-3